MAVVGPAPSVRPPIDVVSRGRDRGVGGREAAAGGIARLRDDDQPQLREDKWKGMEGTWMGLDETLDGVG